LYYITDRSQFAGDEKTRRGRLLAKIAEAARAGVDYIQLRERDLSTRELEALAREAVNAVQAAQGDRRTCLLINSRVDVAIAAGAGGVHLRSDDIAPGAARAAGGRADNGFVVAVSCHTAAEVRSAEAQEADFAVFAPVFEKTTAPQRQGSGLAALRAACTGRIPVLALGGVTLENAASCLQAGAAGIAAIRLFQEHDVADTVLALRRLAE
jgi:thiamine-phosphate pyrophosphorylase